MVEILSVTPEGLRAVKNFRINGKVDVLKFFRPQVRTEIQELTTDSPFNFM